MAAQRGFAEDATDPMVTPHDYDVGQSGRVLELQNSDLWLRPTDLSVHLLILMTIREEPFKNQDLHDSSVALMLREMQREVNTGHHFTLITLPIILRLSSTQQMTLIVALWLSFQRENQPDPES